MSAPVVSLLFLAAFTWFFLKTRMGVAMRAVADNQTVSMGMGINVRALFRAGLGADRRRLGARRRDLGRMLGVDNQLPLVGLKVFPVVILGGLDSIIGAVVGGLIVGVVESLAAGYLDPLVGGGTKDFAPYVLMIVVLMIKPYGTVRHARGSSGVMNGLAMLHREVRSVQDQLRRRHGALAAARSRAGRWRRSSCCSRSSLPAVAATTTTSPSSTCP